ncbi:MAG: 50S ribosomal protein L16 [Elusimicrobia bacterium]|nr:50S ribosomal protein L16 [Elusimicrobiota bacterium]
MLSPKRVKYRKMQRGRMKGNASGGTDVSFGEYGVQSLGTAWVTANQIEACRIALTRAISKNGRVWIRIFPDKPFTKKPAETRMGKGKGLVESWVAVVKPGRVMFEISGLEKAEAIKAFNLVAHKLPIRVRFLERGQ